MAVTVFPGLLRLLLNFERAALSWATFGHLLALCSFNILSFVALAGKHSVSLAIDCSLDRVNVSVHIPREEVDHLHVAANLRWYLLEHLFGEGTSLNGLCELDELDDISLGLVVLVVAQDLLIGVQLVHHLKVVLAHTHDNH